MKKAKTRMQRLNAIYARLAAKNSKVDKLPIARPKRISGALKKKRDKWRAQKRKQRRMAKRHKVKQPNRLIVSHDPFRMTKRGRKMWQYWLDQFSNLFARGPSGQNPKSFNDFNPDHVFSILADALQTAYEEVAEK